MRRALIASLGLFALLPMTVASFNFSPPPQPTAAKPATSTKSMIVAEAATPTPTPTVEPPPAPTWQDNPQGCNQQTQWIAAEEPFSCIDKPAPPPEPIPAAQVAAIPAVDPPAPIVSGSHQDWMAAAGIAPGDWGYVEAIVSRESGWNPNALNPTSGACGLGQQLPCGKWPGAWNDPVAALRAMSVYVTDRYGGWSQAVAFWDANSWY